MTIAGRDRRYRRERVDELTEVLGIAYCADRKPAQLSGGEQQRVAIAVAVANQPEVLFADEPTGELDTATSEQVFNALRTANRELGVTVVVVTHDPMVATAGRPHDRDPRRPYGERGAPPDADQRARPRRGDRGGVRGARPGRPGAAAARLRRRARAQAAGPARARADHVGVWPDQAQLAERARARWRRRRRGGGVMTRPARSTEGSQPRRREPVTRLRPTRFGQTPSAQPTGRSAPVALAPAQAGRARRWSGSRDVDRTYTERLG